MSTRTPTLLAFVAAGEVLRATPKLIELSASPPGRVGSWLRMGAMSLALLFGSSCKSQADSLSRGAYPASAEPAVSTLYVATASGFKRVANLQKQIQQAVACADGSYDVNVIDRDQLQNIDGSGQFLSRAGVYNFSVERGWTLAVAGSLMATSQCTGLFSLAYSLSDEETEDPSEQSGTVRLVRLGDEYRTSPAFQASDVMIPTHAGGALRVERKGTACASASSGPPAPRLAGSVITLADPFLYIGAMNDVLLFTYPCAGRSLLFTLDATKGDVQSFQVPGALRIVGRARDKAYFLANDSSNSEMSLLQLSGKGSLRHLALVYNEDISFDGDLIIRHEKGRTILMRGERVIDKLNVETYCKLNLCWSISR